MTVEELVISYLLGLGFDAFAEVPSDRPAKSVEVRRTGGGSEMLPYVDEPVLSLDVRAPTRAEAASLMHEVDVAMLSMDERSDQVSSVERDSLYVEYEEGDGGHYQASYALVSFLEG